MARRQEKMAPFFLDGPAGRLFALLFEPKGEVRGQALFCPAFAEEMNKSRRAVALTARAMAEVGFRTLLLDLRGTGDSDGEFADATWSGWLQDISSGLEWLRKTGEGKVALWGMRLGTSLALETARRNPGSTSRLILWQPVISGNVFMTQFLRLKIAAQLTGDESRLTTAEIRAEMAQGRDFEIAGYLLSPGLLRAIEKIDLRRDMPPGHIPVDLFEVVADGNARRTSVNKNLCEIWSKAGTKVSLTPVVGEPFWSTQEIATAPLLTSAMVDLLGSAN